MVLPCCFVRLRVPEVRCVTGVAGDRVDEEPAARERRRSPTPNRRLCEAVRSAPSGVGWSSRWPCTAPVATRPAGEHRARRALDAQRDVDLAAAAGPGGHQDGKGGDERRERQAKPVQRVLLPREASTSDRGRQVSGSDASPGFPGRPLLPGPFGPVATSGDAGRTPSQRRDRAGFAPASLDRSRSAESGAPGGRLWPGSSESSSATCSSSSRRAADTDASSGCPSRSA